MLLAAGDRLGPYELVAPLGAGGMGQVWKARDTRLDRLVAIKQLTDRHGPRFEQEARAVAALNHPHICQIFDIGPDYLVMEYVEGKPLSGPLSVQEALRLALQIASAVEEAHSNGILHRDLKPSNVVVTRGLPSFSISDSEARRAIPPGSDADHGRDHWPCLQSRWREGRSTSAPTFLASVRCWTKCDGAAGVHRTLDRASAQRRFTRGTGAAGDPCCPLVHYRQVSRKAAAGRFASAAELRVALEGVAAGNDRSHTGTPVRSAATIAAKPRMEESPDQPSIAVLPFANMSGDKENEYFSDGLAEEILNLLAKIPGLSVIARTSSFINMRGASPQRKPHTSSA